MITLFLLWYRRKHRFRIPDLRGFTLKTTPYRVDPQTGIILAHGAEPHWLPCDGRKVSIAEYPELYNVIGHTYERMGKNR